MTTTKEDLKPTLLNQVFDKDHRIVALAGIKNSGKTNNLIYLLVDYRLKGNTTPIYSFGLPDSLKPIMKKLNIKEISSLRQLTTKESCLLILDECQKLHLTDRRYKDILNEFVDFVYHKNVFCILSSPNIREFNSVIGGVIERWLLKSVDVDQCINGSQLKKVVDEHKGYGKTLGSIVLKKNELLIINNDYEKVINCDYVKEADHKITNTNLF